MNTESFRALPTAPPRHAAAATQDSPWPGVVSLALVILVALALLVAVTAQRGPSPVQASVVQPDAAPASLEQPRKD